MTWSATQKLIFVLAALFFAHAVAGLIVNPDFSTGADATSEKLWGVDFNGWHAVAGFALWGPAMVYARWRKWTVLYGWLTVGILLVTAVWGLLDSNPLGLLFFPGAVADSVFHVVSAVMVAGALLIGGKLDERVSASGS